MEHENSSIYVASTTSEKNFAKILQGINSKYPLLIEGLMGCGKSFLLQRVAETLKQKNTLIELHLDDQTDSKSLIGSYICSDVPGDFVWKPGLITQAVSEGYWIILDGIDKAPLEVIAALSSLLDRNVLLLPAAQLEITAHENFRIIGLRTISKEEINRAELLNQLPSLKSFSSLWHIIRLESPTDEEINNIVERNFPNILSSIRERILLTYKLFNDDSGLINFGSIWKGFRQFTLRDIMKVSKRISSSIPFNPLSTYVTESQLMICLCEVIDVFSISIRNIHTAMKVCHELAKVWGLLEVHVEELMLIRSPVLTVNDVSLQVGRVSLSVAQSPTNNLSPSSYNSIQLHDGLNPTSTSSDNSFAMTRQSLRLLERVACCVKMVEPVLLIGETGRYSVIILAK